MNNQTDIAVKLLSSLIRVPSFSGEENGTRDLLVEFLKSNKVNVQTEGNNVFAMNTGFAKGRPTLLLNSHHDTVKPNSGYTKDPFEPVIDDGKLYGLGSNDAGASLVCLLLTFLEYHRRKDLPLNILFAASAEEEISGKGGIERLLKVLPPIDLGIVGEPTSGDVAVAEKGLLVLDCIVTGKAGHAARNEGDNAIYRAMEEIRWFREYKFPKTSDTLGPIHMNVTVIEAGHQHNVVPDTCKFTVDVRTTDAYTLEETLEIIRSNVGCTVEPRSVRLRPSGISTDHPLYRTVASLGMQTYGSPTLSDQALMPFPTIKIGPGDSARSHTADEFVFISQIEEGLIFYRNIIDTLINQLNHETLG